MKFRVSLAGSNSSGSTNGMMGGLNTGAISNVAMNFVSTGNNSISNVLGGLSQQGGIILSSDEVLEVSYSTTPVYVETMSASQSQVSLRIVGRLIPVVKENQNEEMSQVEGIASGIMGALGMGTLFNQYKSVKSLFDRDKEEKIIEKENNNNFNSSLLSSSGEVSNEKLTLKDKKDFFSENSSQNKKNDFVSQVLGVSSMLPMTSSFANGISKSLGGMFGGLSSFGAGDLYTQNKQNIKLISEWAMKFDEKNATKDVLVQTDLGGGTTFELYFPKMYVAYFDQNFSTGTGEGYFVLELKQTVFNEEGNTLK